MSSQEKKRQRRSFRRDWRKSDNPKDWGFKGDDVSLVKRIPVDSGKRLVKVYVEGYSDVAFWRGIFDDFESDTITFEISVPQRADMAKGKKVLLSMINESSKDMLLCADSDFDYLFEDATEQSSKLYHSQYMFHTYVYATENYSCYAPSLHNVCVKATKNDTKIFDFEKFLAEYSQTIYPLFLWYAYSARSHTERLFPLVDFRNSVRLSYLDTDENGRGTVEWLGRQVKRRLKTLEESRPDWVEHIEEFGQKLIKKGVIPQNVYLFMQGHTLMDNVVLIALHAVCEKLKEMSLKRINRSEKRGQALQNERSNYNNALQGVRGILLDNEQYKDCFLYKLLKEDIQRYVDSLEE